MEAIIPAITELKIILNTTTIIMKIRYALAKFFLLIFVFDPKAHTNIIIIPIKGNENTIIASIY